MIEEGAAGTRQKKVKSFFIYNIAGKEFWENGDYDEKEEETRKKSFSYFFLSVCRLLLPNNQRHPWPDARASIDTME